MVEDSFKPCLQQTGKVLVSFYDLQKQVGLLNAHCVEMEILSNMMHDQKN